MNTYAVLVGIHPLHTVKASCKREAISTALSMLSYSYSAIMPIVDHVEDMCWHEIHIEYYAYIVPTGSLYVKCNLVENVRE